MACNQHLILGCILFMNNIATVPSASWEDARELYNNLLNGYIKDFRPVQNQSHSIVVNITFHPIFIHDVNEVSGTLTFMSYIYAIWKDERIKWDSNSTGIPYFYLPFDKVWTPNLVIANPGLELKNLGDDHTKVKFFSDGIAVWQPPIAMTTACSIDVKLYPFDNQKCFILMNSWMDGPDEVKLRAPVSDIDMRNFQKNGEWDVMNATIMSLDTDVVSVILITLDLRRRPIFIVVNIILPILFLGVINPVVFIVPVDSGERISYASTILLAFAVFMTLVSDRLPETSEPQAIISTFLLLFLVYSIIILFLAVLSLRLYFKSNDNPVPRYVKRMLSCRIFCGEKYRENISKKKINHIEDNDSGTSKIDPRVSGGEALYTNWRSVALTVDSIFFVCSLIVFTVLIIVVSTHFL